MIIRIWRGAVRAENAEEYLRHQVAEAFGPAFQPRHWSGPRRLLGGVRVATGYRALDSFSAPL